MIKLYNGDFRKIVRTKIRGESINLIYTDLPYPRSYAPLYESLAMMSNNIMCEGGSLVIICPHYLLPEVVGYFSKSGLKYRWILNMNQNGGSHPRMLMGIEVCWKPMLWYVKNKFIGNGIQSGKGYVKDSIEITQPKKMHKWQQDISWAEYYIPRLCAKGGTVLDVAMGTGTSGVIAKKFGLDYIGIELDKMTFQHAEKRINGSNIC